MTRSTTLFLQAAIVLIGIGALVFLFGEPHLEGRNAHATLFQIYFNDPFLAYAYLGSISFFVGLYKAFTLFGYMGQGKAFLLDSVRALRSIKHCALILAGFVAAAVAYLFIVRPGDDIAGGVFMGLLVLLASAVTVVVAAVFERALQRVMA